MLYYVGLIGELGFGSGLNFLITFDFFTKSKIEKYLHIIIFQNPLNQYQLQKFIIIFKLLNHFQKTVKENNLNIMHS